MLNNFDSFYDLWIQSFNVDDEVSFSFFFLSLSPHFFLSISVTSSSPSSIGSERLYKYWTSRGSDFTLHSKVQGSYHSQFWKKNMEWKEMEVRRKNDTCRTQGIFSSLLPLSLPVNKEREREEKLRKKKKLRERKKNVLSLMIQPF